jgi:hypothetical protein
VSAPPSESAPTTGQPASARTTTTVGARIASRPDGTGAPTRRTSPGGTASPDGLTVDRLGIAAPVDLIDTGLDGVLRPPSDVRRVGLWAPGARPGDDVGTVVLAGHVSDRQQGRGALWPLRESRPGDRVTVDGIAYEVTHVETRPKSDLPKGIWTVEGRPVLVIITCGGQVRRGTYTHNVLVYAVPVQAP